jgi:hypothetical protein
MHGGDGVTTVDAVLRLADRDGLGIDQLQLALADTTLTTPPGLTSPTRLSWTRAALSG